MDNRITRVQNRQRTDQLKASLRNDERQMTILNYLAIKLGDEIEGVKGNEKILVKLSTYEISMLGVALSTFIDDIEVVAGKCE